MTTRRGLPQAYPGMRIGLFGGSFDPAHAGHEHVAETAAKRLRLDKVWWMVTPQNPLKPQSSPLGERVASAQRFARGRKMVVTALEAQLACRYTYQTLRKLKRLYPGVHFVLVMGADNLDNFKRWKKWREVGSSLPVAIISRPLAGTRSRTKMCKDWIYLPARLHRENSTALRAPKRRPVAKPKPK
jgi:nicotinate-nucleotide adenylyltransferase